MEQTDRERGLLQCYVWTWIIRIRLAHKTIQKKETNFPSESVTNVNMESVENITTAEVSGKVSVLHGVDTPSQSDCCADMQH